MQKTDGCLRLIVYASRKLSVSRKLNAWSLKHFREILLGYATEVLTDHHPVVPSLKLQVPERPPSMLDRHVIGVQPNYSLHPRSHT